MSHLYFLFLNLHIIKKLREYMNSVYWRKTLNCQTLWTVSRTSTIMAVKLKKWHQNYLLCRQGVNTWSRKPCEARDSRHVDKWVRKYGRHVSTQGTLASAHGMHIDTWAREYVRHAKHVGTWACEHVST